MILKMLESKAIKTIDNTAVTIEVLTLDSVKKCFLLLLVCVFYHFYFLSYSSVKRIETWLRFVNNILKFHPDFLHESR